MSLVPSAFDGESCSSCGHLDRVEEVDRSGIHSSLSHGVWDYERDFRSFLRLSVVAFLIGLRHTSHSFVV